MYSFLSLPMYLWMILNSEMLRHFTLPSKSSLTKLHLLVVSHLPPVFSSPTTSLSSSGWTKLTHKRLSYSYWGTDISCRSAFCLEPSVGHTCHLEKIRLERIPFHSIHITGFSISSRIWLQRIQFTNWTFFALLYDWIKLPEPVWLQTMRTTVIRWYL